jgi:hypothetical protein
MQGRAVVRADEKLRTGRLKAKSFFEGYARARCSTESAPLVDLSSIRPLFREARAVSKSSAHSSSASALGQLAKTAAEPRAEALVSDFRQSIERLVAHKADCLGVHVRRSFSELSAAGEGQPRAEPAPPAGPELGLPRSWESPAQPPAAALEALEAIHQLIFSIHQHVAEVHRLVSQMFAPGSGQLLPSSGVSTVQPTAPGPRLEPGWPRQPQSQQALASQTNHLARGPHKGGYLGTAAGEASGRPAKPASARQPSSKKPAAATTRREPVLAMHLEKKPQPGKKAPGASWPDPDSGRSAIWEASSSFQRTARETRAPPTDPQPAQSPASLKLPAEELTFIVDDEMFLRDKRGSLVRDDEGRSIHLTHGQWQRLLREPAPGEAEAD